MSLTPHSVAADVESKSGLAWPGRPGLRAAEGGPGGVAPNFEAGVMGTLSDARSLAAGPRARRRGGLSDSEGRWTRWTRMWEYTRWLAGLRGQSRAHFRVRAK